MYKTHVDLLKNRMYLTFRGTMTLDELKEACAQILQEAKRLKPRFGVISDIAELVPTTEEGRLVMQTTMKTLKQELGMGHAVRIVTEKALVSANQWQRTSRAVGYLADQAPSLAEAETLLDKLEKG